MRCGERWGEGCGKRCGRGVVAGREVWKMKLQGTSYVPHHYTVILFSYLKSEKSQR